MSLTVHDITEQVMRVTVEIKILLLIDHHWSCKLLVVCS